jgi:hypothetical protein
MVATSALYSGRLGDFPVLRPESNVNEYNGLWNGNRYEGFTGDGDYIELPTAAGNSVEYFNSAGSSQWTVAKEDIHASVEDWCGFFFDGSLIYGVVVDEGTTPNTYYTYSINSAGTVTNIGNAQPSPDFETAAAGWWNVGLTTSGGSNVQRALKGSGNIFMSQVSATNGEFAEIDISNGTFVSAPADIVSSQSRFPAYRTANGVWFNWSNETFGFAKSNADGGSFLTGTNSNLVIEYLAMGGLDVNSSRKLVTWKDDVVVALYASGASMGSTRHFDRANFDTFMETIYEWAKGK